MTRLADGIATTLESLADGLLSRRNLDVFEKILVDARDLRRLRDAAASDITRAGDSLMLNPRGAKHRDLLDPRQGLPGLAHDSGHAGPRRGPAPSATITTSV